MADEQSSSGGRNSTDPKKWATHANDKQERSFLKKPFEFFYQESGKVWKKVKFDPFFGC